jgi:hypothetical protein
MGYRLPAFVLENEVVYRSFYCGSVASVLLPVYCLVGRVEEWEESEETKRHNAMLERERQEAEKRKPGKPGKRRLKAA